VILEQRFRRFPLENAGISEGAMIIGTRSQRKSQSRKLKHARTFATLSAATSVIAWTHFVQADTWANNGGTALNNSGSWIDETSPSTDSAPPSSTDIAQFDFHDALSGTNTYTLGAATSWLGLSIVNPTGGIVIGNSGDSSNTLTLGASGINMSLATQNLTIADPLAISQNLSFTVAGGQTLSVSNGISMAASSTLTFSGAGNQYITGVLNDGGGGGAISQLGTGTVVLTASNSYTGATTVDSGTLELNFAASGAPSSNIAPSGSALRIGGGTLLINGGSGGGSQTFASSDTTPSQGLTTVELVKNGTAPTLNMGTIAVDTSSSNAGGLIDFVGPATSSDGLDASPIAATGTIQIGNSQLGTGNILLDSTSAVPFGVVGQPGAPNTVTDFAAVSSGVVVGGSTIGGFYTPLPTSGGESFTGTTNYDVTTAGEIRISSNSTLTSLRFNTPTGGNYNGSGYGSNNMDQIILKSGNVLEPGAILVTPNVGANPILIQDAGGPTVPMLGGEGNNIDVTVFQYNPAAPLIIDGGIRAANGHNGGYAQAGPGTVQLNGTAVATTYTLPTNLYGGLTILGNASGVSQGLALGGSTSINLNGGNLDTDYTGTIDDSTVPARPITVGAMGGGVSATAGNTLTVDGAITGIGALNIGYGTLQTNEENATSLTLTTTNTNGSGWVVLSGGASNTYSGGTNVNYGNLQLDSASAGTGNIVVNSGGTFSGTATGLTNSVFVKSGGTLTPGNATSSGPALGTLGLSSLNLSTNSILEFGMSGSSSSGLIDVSKSLVIGSSPDDVKLYFANTTDTFTNSGTYDLLDVTSGGTISGSVSNFAVTDTYAGLNYAFQTASDGSGGEYVQLVITGGGTVYTWATNGSGAWNSGSNWSPNTSFPNNYLSTADLFGAYTGSGTATISLNQAVEVGTLNFNNTSGSYLIAAGSGGSLSLGGAASVEDLAGNHSISAPITLAANASFDVAGSSNSLTLSGAITGSFNLTAGGNHGTGTIILANTSNTYSGTTVTAGILQVGNGSSNGSLGSGSVTIGSAGTLTFDNPSAYNLTDNVTASASTSVLNQNGAGELELSGTNNLGTVNIASGSAIQVTSAGGLTSTSGNLTMSGTALLDLDGNAASVGALSGTGTIDSVTNTGASTLTTGSDNNSTSFSGVIQNTNGSVALVKTGNGTLTLSGNNTFSGGTTINGGAITPANNNAFGNSSGTITDNVTDGLEFTVSGITISNPIADGDTAAEFADVPSGTATIAGAITMVGGDSYREGTSGGTLIFTGATTITSNNTILTRGNIVFSGSGASLTNATNAIDIGRNNNASSLNLTIQNDAVFSGDGLNLGGLDGTSDDVSTSIALASGGQLVASGGSVLDLDNSGTANSTIGITVSGGASITAGSFTSTSVASGTSVTMTLNGGSITANASSASFFPNLSSTVSVTVGSSGGTINNGGFNITFAQPISGSFGDGGIISTGAGTTTITGSNSYTGPTKVTGGTLVVGAAGALPSGTAVVIGASSELQLATQTGGETLSSLSIANTSGGTLDITNNHVIINYTTDPKATILQYLSTGSAGGAWDGAGIISSTAASNPAYGVGFADGADGVDTSLSSGEIEVAYAQYGDITLSGLVNANDFHILTSNFGKIVTGGWEDGDFTYSGTVNANDFHLLTQNFGKTETGEDISLPAADYAAIDAFAAANGLTVSNAVPEPTSMALVAITGAGLLARRRRRA
jgi:fibronectin-binding autotransporter adhesin